MSPPASIAQRLREVVAARAILVPGVSDALGARIASAAGFDALFLSGYGLSAARLGEPDLGLVTATEMADAARAVCRVSAAPVIVDADTGYGNALNVQRAVRELAAAGAAGVVLEDQVWPKRCGHMAGKRVIAADEHAAKVRAARDAADVFVVARTDARQPHGLDEALDRARAYKEAGADALFVEAPQSAEELRRIGAELPGPLVASMVEGGATPLLSRGELEALGFAIVLWPVTALFAAARAMQDALVALRTEETTASVRDRMLDFAAMNALVDAEGRAADEARYA